MMKKIIKPVLISLISAFMLAGCAGNTVSEENSTSASSSSAASKVDEIVTSSTETSTSTESKPVESSATSTSSAESKPAESSSTSTSTTSSAVEKPVESSSTSSSTESKPVVKPTTSSTTTSTTTSKPTEKPVESKPTSSTSSSTITSKPVEKPTHNCDFDGHVWKELTPKTSTETVEIVETHIVSANGYDYTLAHRYFGRKDEDINFASIFGNVYSSGSTDVKTTGTKTITEYTHKCTECGFEEVYNTEETVNPGETWEFVNKSRSKYFKTVWYDINNIPDEVYEAVEKDNKECEDFWDTF